MKQDFAQWSLADRFRHLLSRLTGTARSSPDATSDPALPASRSRCTSGVFATALLIGSSVWAGAAHADLPTDIPITNEIRFGVSVDGNEGHVICALFRKAGWLKTPVQWKKASIRANEAECIFSSVPQDTYAISAFHDENDNEHLDTNFIGIPTESWCTSRDARAYFGPPSFDDAKFRYTGSVMRQRVSLK